MQKKRIVRIICSVCLILLGIGLFAFIFYSNTKNAISQSNGQPPTMNNSNSSGNTSGSTPPSMPGNSSSSNSSSSNNQTGYPPSMPSNMNSMATGLSLLQFGLMGVSILLISIGVSYLIASKMGKYSLSESVLHKKRLLISALAFIVCITGTGVGEYFLLNSKSSSQPQSMKMNQNQNSSSNVTATAAKTITSDTSLSQNYSTSKSDTNTLLVKSGANLILNNATINKTGNVSNMESSEFYGINSAILVQKGSASISNSTITTNAKGSNAVFSTGSSSKITIKNSTIKTTGTSGSRGLDATYGGKVDADNVTITTNGQSSASLATDRGEGTVTASNSTLTTIGKGSPLIYSTGNITVNKTTGTANNAQIVVVEGKNSATVKNSTLNASATGNRGTVDQAGVMIYQSMSGDAGEGNGTFTSINSTLSILKTSSYYQSAPMFFITNTSSTINLTNTKLNYGSNILFSIKGTSEWGNSGSNGGNVTVNASNQTLTGNTVLDKLSSIKLNLSKSSYTGAINTDNKAKSVTLTLSKDSTFTLTGNTYLTSLNDKDSTLSNIKTNGYKLYVNGKQVK